MLFVYVVQGGDSLTDVYSTHRESVVETGCVSGC